MDSKPERDFASLHPEPLAYSVADACRVSSLGRTAIYALIKANRLEARKLGRRTLIPAHSLRKLLEGDAGNVG